ncbi:uncharacterized protein LOC127726386 [Mytilus californianus]|uniref:uncharacterized protein LOC127726386 n=1 Tax=Mytilus californianus TaxID=6549 RepID=UPI002246D94B|nr:uncharacterized protein LOC127726386 [Mytilus californianus]
MDREDRRRNFIVGSTILEVVTPVFRQRLEKDYKSKGLGCLQDFINSKPVLHILFHLRHKNTQCCVDSTNCVNHGPLPLNYSQWDLLYIEKPTSGFHHCHCKYSAKVVTLDDLDISLASLILLNCCNLAPNERSLISDLRQFKNNYLSHNTKGAITQAEYTTLWGDPSKQDDFIRIQNRPLDDSLCNKYVVCLLDIHQKLEEISDKLESSTAEILTAMDINNDQIKVELVTKLEEILQYLRCQSSKEKTDRHGIKQQNPMQRYQLGQHIFTLNHQADMTPVVGDGLVGLVSGIVIMDDGRLVICLPRQDRLLICNTDGSQVDSIPVQGKPWCVTEVNNSTVAVTLWRSEIVEIYDINNKLKLKSISPPGLWWWSGISNINNKLVVCGNSRLLIIDHQTGEVVHTIMTDSIPDRLHCSGDKIIYCDYNNNCNNLYWYSVTDDIHHTLILTSHPESMTTLQDGSIYVVCDDEAVRHVSTDGKQYKHAKTPQSISLCDVIHYNHIQRKLVTIQTRNNHVKVFKEI